MDHYHVERGYDHIQAGTIMRYYGTINGEVFFNTDSVYEGYNVTKAEVALELGSAGSATFGIPPVNIFYGDFNKLVDAVSVYRDDDEIFFGRVYGVSGAFDTVHTVSCEGYLAVLNDSVFEPDTYECSLEELFTAIIESHNEKCPAWPISVGELEFTDSYVYRAYENYETSKTRLDDLVDSYGGYLVCRKESDTVYLDWLDLDNTADEGQTINFGENLLDIVQESTASEIITALIPVGATISEEDEDGEITEYVVNISSANDGLMYIYDEDAVETFGWIWGTYTWDDVEEPANLLTKAKTYLTQKCKSYVTINASAVDLSEAGYDYDSFMIGVKNPVVSSPHGIDDSYLCTALDINCLDRTSSTMTLGGERVGIVSTSNKNYKSNVKTVENIIANYATNTALSSVASTAAAALASVTETVSIDSITEYYAVSSDGTTAPDDDEFDTAVPSMTTVNKYLWNYEEILYSDDHTDTTDKRVIGVYGDTGTSGVGISSVTEYYAVSSSGSTAPSTWSETVPTLTSTNKYLWNYEAIAYTDGTTTSTDPAVIGVYGDTGEDGSDGVGISGITEYYARSTSNSTTPSSWSTTVPTLTSTYKYLWNYETVTYTDGNTTSTTPAVIGAYGDTGDSGTSVTISSAAVSYCASSSGTTTPTSGWSSTVPSVSQGQFLWTRTVVTYSDDTTTTSYSVAYIGSDGSDGSDGVGVDSITEHYARSTSNTTAPSSWSTTAPTLTSTYKYLWNYETVAYTDGTSSDTDKHVIGVYGDTGATGSDGADGSDGVGISSITEYYARSTSNSTAPSSWSTTVPTLTSTYKYLWNYEVVTYTDSTTETTDKRVIGVYGDTGDDGTSVSIESTEIAYQASDSGTTTPTGTWSTTVPSVSQGQYLWTRTIVTYSDGTSTTAYSVSYVGEDGTSVSVASTSITYAASSSGTTAPSSWSTSIPTVSQGQYLWTKTVVTYTDASSTTSYSVSYNAIDGEDADALTITAKAVTYQLSSSGTTTPTGTWSSSIPTLTQGYYLWTRTVVTYSDDTSVTSYSVAYIAVDGDAGNGVSSITNYYLASASSSGVTTSTSGWTASVQTPTASKPYLWNYELISYTLADDEETEPAIIGMYSEDGVSVSSVTEEYALSTSSSEVTEDWSTDIPTMTSTYKYLWNRETVNFSDGNYETTDPVVIGVYGDSGSDGANFAWNLLDGTKDFSGWNGASTYVTETDDDGFGIASFPQTDTLSWRNVSSRPILPYTLVRGKTVCVSVEIRSDTEWDSTSSNVPSIQFALTASTSTTSRSRFRALTNSIISDGDLQPTLTDEWQKIYGVIDVDDSLFTSKGSSDTGDEASEDSGFYVSLYVYTTAGLVEMRKPKLEIGDTATEWAPSYDDVYGVGIESIVNYYGTSADSATEPTSWDTDVPDLTESEGYLWNYEVITYTDGTTSTTDPAVIGVYGDYATSDDLTGVADLAAAQTGANLLQDGGFEAADYWDGLPDGMYLDSDNPHSGTYSMACTSGISFAYLNHPYGSSAKSTYNLISVEPGQTYRLTAYCMISDDAEFDSSNTKVRIGDSSGSLIYGLDASKATTEWTKLSYTWTNTSYTEVQIQLYQAVTSGTVWWDDIRFELDTATSGTARSYFAMDSTSVEISSGTIAFDAGTITIDSDNFTLDEDGNITASSAVISGTITAGAGSEVGGWTIGSGKIYAGDSDTGVAVMQKPTSSTTYCFGAGGTSHSDYSDCPFRVTKAGKLYASDAVIDGTLSAGAGSTIGGWTATSGKIYAGDSDTGVAVMQIPTESTTTCFGAGGTSHSDYSDCPFRVTKAGAVYASKLTVTGDMNVELGDNIIFAGSASSIYATISSATESSTGANQLNIYGKNTEIHIYSTEYLELGYDSASTIISGNAIQLSTSNTTIDGSVNAGGTITVSKDSGSATFIAERSDTEYSVTFGVGSGGYNRGVYDKVVDSWMLYADSSDNIHLGTDTIGNRHRAVYLSSGVVSEGLFVQNGSVTITPSAANTPTSVSVTFDEEFSGVYLALANPASGYPGTVVTGCCVSSVSTTGCTIVLTRTNTTSTTVRWIAFGY